MKPLEKNSNDLIFVELFAKISPEIADSFNQEQLEAIKKAFCSPSWNRHPLDLRVSVPILELQFYLVFLAGRERRSKERLRSERGVYPLWTPTNLVFLIGFFSVITTSSFIVFPFLFSSLFSLLIAISTAQPNPTSIPWLENKLDCEHTGRTWRDHKCWDYEHNPMF